jgi:RNA 2',3'-cyclic 3'-phosphodiesterase
MKRLFIAFKITPDTNYLSIYNRIKNARSADRITWVKPDITHFTLHFFGEMAENKIPVISECARKAVSEIESFEIQIANTGIFGSRYDPRVIWFGIVPNEKLTQLHSNLKNELAAQGWIPDRQNFVPHITVGRIKEIRDKSLFQDDMSKLRTIAIMKQNVDHITLYESILRPQGPEYIALEQFKLK